MNTKLLGCLVVAAASCLRGLAGDWYVAENGRDADDAGSESDPFASIAFAVSKAGDNDTVHVAEGTYSLAVETVIEKPVVVEGSGDRAKTILKKVRGVRPFTLNDDGAVIRNLLIDGSNGGWGPGQGGGVFLTKGTVDQCVIQFCSSSNTQGGGGIRMDGGLVTRSVIRYNQAINTNPYGSGVRMLGGRLENCLVYRNGYSASNVASSYGDKGGGVSMEGAGCVVANCTIADNNGRSNGGLFRKAGCGTVYNTLVYGNALFVSGDADIAYGLAVGETVEDVFRNCASSTEVGANAQAINVRPFDGDYKLVPLNAAKLIDKGDNAFAAGELDFFGGVRRFNDGVVDIGAHEVQDASVKLTFSSSSLVGVGELTPTLAAEMVGADIADYECSWYFDGSATVGATGAVVTPTFDTVGAHSVRLVATLGDEHYEKSEQDYIVIRPAVVTVGVDAADVDAALALATLDGQTVRIPEGTYTVNAQIVLSAGVTVEGVGAADRVILERGDQIVGSFAKMTHSGAVLRNLTLDGKMVWTGEGGGVYMQNGRVEGCVLYRCSSGNTNSGGGIYMVDGVVTRTAFRNCQVVGSGPFGAGIYMLGGRVDNSIFVSCGANSGGDRSYCRYGGGIHLAGADAVVENCTIIDCASQEGGGGIWRDAGKGKVYNTLVYGNAALKSGEPDIGYALSATEMAEDVFRNCASSKAVGANAQAIGSSPVDEDCRLIPQKAGLLINGGDNQYVTSETDFFGAPRIYQGKTVDIGANEVQSEAVILSFTSSAFKGLDLLSVTLTASILPVDLADYDCFWYFDGAKTPDKTGAVTTKDFAIGRHSVRLVAVNKADPSVQYEAEEELGWITVYPSVITVGETTDYADVNSAIAVAMLDGMTVRIPEGVHELTNQIVIGSAVTIEGLGNFTNVVLRRKHGAFGGSCAMLNHDRATLRNLTLEGTLEWSGTGGGVNLKAGLVEHCRICKFSSSNTADGGGINMSGGVVTRSVVRECRTVGYGSGNGCGVYISGGRLDNSIVCCNRPEQSDFGKQGGGICINGRNAVVANCLVFSNACFSSGGIYRGANGGKVCNTIVFGNTLQNTAETDGDTSDIAFDLAAGETAEDVFSCLCTPEAVGAGCVTGDPLFRDAANGDFRLKADSPCVRKGVWLDWMTVDFAGNRRVTRPGAKVDIGIYQSDRGLTVIVR